MNGHWSSLLVIQPDWQYLQQYAVDIYITKTLLFLWSAFKNVIHEQVMNDKPGIVFVNALHDAFHFEVVFLRKQTNGVRGSVESFSSSEAIQ